MPQSEPPDPTAAPGLAESVPGHGPVPRPSGARRRVATGLAISAIIATVLTVAVVTGNALIGRFDQGLTDLTRGWADSLEWPVDIAHTLGRVTAPVWSAVAAAVLALLLVAARHRAAAAYLAVSAISGVVTTEALKLSIGRVRPPGADEFESQRELTKSFPSGHSAAGIYLYLTTGLILIHLGRVRRSRWLTLLGRFLVLLGPTIGVSRLVLGVHWPSDVLAGWSVGSAASMLAALLLWTALDRGWDDPGTAGDISSEAGDIAPEPEAEPGRTTPAP